MVLNLDVRVQERGKLFDNLWAQKYAQADFGVQARCLSLQ